MTIDSKTAITVSFTVEKRKQNRGKIFELQRLQQTNKNITATMQ